MPPWHNCVNASTTKDRRGDSSVQHRPSMRMPPPAPLLSSFLNPLLSSDVLALSYVNVSVLVL